MGVVEGHASGDAAPLVARRGRTVAWGELAAHRRDGDVWIALRGQVFDVSEFAREHPGGLDNILLAGGRECTSLFASYHPLWVWRTQRKKLARMYVGELAAGGDGADAPQVHNDNISDFYVGMKREVEDYFKRTGQDPRRSLDIALRIPFVLLSIAGLHYLAMHRFADQFGLQLALTAVHGLFSAFACLTAVHEASHSAVLHTPSLWKSIGAVAHNFLNGANFHVWQNQHIVGHHLLTNVHDGDPDIAGELFRFSPNYAWQPHHALQYVLAPLAYGLLSLRTRIRDVLLFAAERPAFGPVTFNFGRHSLEMALLVTAKIFFVAYRIVLPIVCGMSVGRCLGLVMFSDWLGSFYLAFLFQCNHVVARADFPVADPRSGKVDRDWAKMQIATTQDYGHDSYATYWMTGALNYQVTHHLFPYISQGHYRAIAPIIKAYCAKHNVEYIARPTFLEAAKAHIGKLYELAQKPKEA